MKIDSEGKFLSVYKTLCSRDEVSAFWLRKKYSVQDRSIGS